jgi:hypothetical protein
MDSMTQYGSISASNSSSDGPLVPISHSPDRKDVKKKASRGASIATIQHNSTRASGDASLVTMQHHSTQANGDAPLVKTTPLRKSPCTSGEHQNETQSSGDASLVATSLQPWRSYASGEASLVTNIQQKVAHASGDAPLAEVSLQCKRQCASGDASLAKTATRQS